MSAEDPFPREATHLLPTAPRVNFKVGQHSEPGLHAQETCEGAWVHFLGDGSPTWRQHNLSGQPGLVKATQRGPTQSPALGPILKGHFQMTAS